MNDHSPQGLTVVLSPPPTPNGPLHVGHLSGPYVAADIAVRAARRRGELVLSVCGLDDHQNYVPAAARARHVSVRELRNANAVAIRGALQRVGVAHDIFIEPMDDVGYRDGVARLFSEFVARGVFTMQRWTVPECGACAGTLHHAYVVGLCRRCDATTGGGTCETCGSFATASQLQQPRCTRCGSEPSGFRTMSVPTFRLVDYAEGLGRVWATASFPPRVRRLIEHALSDGLPTVPLSYPTDWGIGDTERAGYRIDVWIEMVLGYLLKLGRHIDPAAHSVDELVTAWASVGSLWAFLGIDNAFYYAILFPALLLAAGVPAGTIGGLIVNEFYRLDGAKFSTSRGHAIWADEAIERVGPTALRAFLCWDRPGSYASDFTAERLAQVCASWPSDLNSVAVAEGESARAERALTLAHWAPDLAVRCLLGRSVANEPTEAGAELIRVITGNLSTSVS